MRGQSGAAWTAYRFLYQAAAFEKKRLSLPMWCGPSQTGKGIVLYSDQGFGDAIQFLRFAPLVRPYCSPVLLHAPGELARLFSATGWFDDFLPDPGYRDRYPEGIKTVGAQCYAPLSSLPGIFNAAEGKMPAPTPCWADPEAVARYRGQLRVGEMPLVGVAWRGKRITPRDPVRSLASTDILPLTGVPGIRLVMLQWGATGDEVRPFEDAGGINLGTEIAERQWDYAVTAAALTHLNLVVTCDSVIAHLAASLGIKTWVALPVASEWRWQLERRDSPWYRAVRLFRQREFGVWGPVIAEIADAIRRGEWRD
jgi:hypothetical protein